MNDISNAFKIKLSFGLDQKRFASGQNGTVTLDGSKWMTKSEAIQYLKSIDGDVLKFKIKQSTT